MTTVKATAIMGVEDEPHPTSKRFRLRKALERIDDPVEVLRAVKNQHREQADAEPFVEGNPRQRGSETIR